MLKQESITKIAELLRIDNKALSDAITADAETEIEIPEISVFTTAEIASRDKNKYNEGKGAGAEMLIKELKESHGVESEGKDGGKFLEAYKAKVLKEANIDPAAGKEVENALRANLAKAETERDEARNTMRGMQLQGKVLSAVEGNFILSKEKVLHLMAADGYTIDEEEGEVIFTRNGAPVRDAKTQNVIPAAKVFESFATESKLTQEAPETIAGRGGRSTQKPSGSPASFDQLKEQWESAGKSVNTAEFTAKAQELAKGNPDFWKQ